MAAGEAAVASGVASVAGGLAEEEASEVEGVGMAAAVDTAAAAAAAVLAAASATARLPPHRGVPLPLLVDPPAGASWSFSVSDREVNRLRSTTLLVN